MILRRSAGRSLVAGWLALAVTATSPPVPAGAQIPLTEAERLFRAEVEPELVPRGGWAVHGYVYSQHEYRVGGVRLRCETLDGSGQVIGQSFGWVVGDIPPRGRAYFYIHVPTRGAGYRVTVLSFYPIARGEP